MIWRALACDYDGTLASEDRLGPDTLGALEATRRAGVRLILVTGRTFFELLRVCERVDVFDAVIAENGGVLYFPAKGMMRSLGPMPPPRLLAALDEKGVSYLAGRTIIGVHRGDEARVRDALTSVGARLENVYNRASLMLVPPGISKGTGVRQAIQALGLSFHDVLAIGDAENDLELFEACGWTACPGDAVPDLKTRADFVFPGDNGRSVAQAIVGPILGDRLPLAASPRHRVAIGWSPQTSEATSVPARGVNILVQGDTLSGKSWLAGALVEHMVERRYSVCVIDPEGDHGVLGTLPGVSCVDVTDEPGWRRALERLDHDTSASVVLDLSALDNDRKVALIAAGLGLIREGLLPRDVSWKHIARLRLEGDGCVDHRAHDCGHGAQPSATDLRRFADPREHLRPAPYSRGRVPVDRERRRIKSRDIRGRATYDLARSPPSEVRRRPAASASLLPPASA